MLATAKIHFLKQFTTFIALEYSYKVIVLATAKIHFLKQFTTGALTGNLSLRLCLLLQRYTFWSNSQLSLPRKLLCMNCACYCKDTLFEAIHNSFLSALSDCWIVLATAKIHFLKQFTTLRLISHMISELCLLLQRYTFWSNSQRLLFLPLLIWYCACYCKDTLFEAIHNNQVYKWFLFCIVLATAKIHFLKQFTTSAGVGALSGHCACYCKDTLFEAIHNRQYRQEQS